MSEENQRKSINLCDLALPITVSFKDYALRAGMIPDEDLRNSYFFAILCAETAALLGVSYAAHFMNSDLWLKTGQLEHLKPIAEAKWKMEELLGQSWIRAIPIVTQTRQQPFQFGGTNHAGSIHAAEAGQLQPGQAKYYLAVRKTAHETALEFANRAIAACGRGNDAKWQRPQNVPILAMEDLSAMTEGIILEVCNASKSVAATGTAIVRKQRRRRRASQRKLTPITPAQLEAAQLVGEHKGNIAAAANAAGKSRTAMEKLYNKALKKLGKSAMPKAKTQAPHVDHRGQEEIEDTKAVDLNRDTDRPSRPSRFRDR